jgi:cytochrome c peroxidase
MGKAQCATCHFIPLFNGLIPPDYALTEFEVLGTTSTDRLDHPHLSRDPGRYTLYPFPFFKGAFKTPTVRNAALTGPYMHNGAFRDLNRLMDFYNKGGGAGLGLSGAGSDPLAFTPAPVSRRDRRYHSLHPCIDGFATSKVITFG